jgi:signal peptidase I
MTVTTQTSASSAPGDTKEPPGLAKATPAKAASGGAVHELLELGKTIFYALLIAFVLRVVLFQPFTIPSESMEPNLLKGDYIIVSKWAYGWSRHSILFSPPIGHGRLLGREPKRGDIIVFKLPRNTSEDYIKRVIGLPGDHVQVVHGQVLLNGKPLPRVPAGQGLEQTAFGQSFPVARLKETLPSGKSFLTYSYGADGPADNTGVYVVPKNCYFMMGDNRDNSLDSRFDPGEIPQGEAACGWNHDVDRFISPDLGVGFVPAEDLEGRADIILFSWKPGVSLFKPWTWFTDARLDRFFHLLG